MPKLYTRFIAHLGKFNNKKESTFQSTLFHYIQTFNYFTSSLKFLPAEKAGTVFAAIFKGAPV